jgi:Asp-tRNA(Asn)/Glu-tRNA(Gln) amidotransferase A subunit family amidase
MDASELTASAAARRLHDGSLRCEELTRACLDRIEANEPTVQAWTHIDPEYALEQARQADERRSSGADVGPLHGLPVGVKDIFDTRDMPTECGTPLMSARQPNQDAAAVTALREAGAIIMGKTVSTELAMYSPGKTTNPHDPAHTPGGSSSGSAAAVATHMVSLAIGSQTNGSVIRPASFCGVYGFKPSFGAISRSGVLALSRPLDTMGVFGRSVEDLALAAESLFGFDERDPDTSLRARQHLVETAVEEPPLPPIFAFVKTPVWEQAEVDTREGFAELVEALGRQCDEVELPALFDDAVRWHRTILCADLAKNLGQLYDTGKDELSDVLRAMIEEGQGCLAVDYNRAVDMIEILNAGLAQIFERYDAILTPAAPGEAPAGLDATGSPIFCSLWTFVGLPAVSLPLLQGSTDLPIGVQMVGARNGDARLLRNAHWLANSLAR